MLYFDKEIQLENLKSVGDQMKKTIEKDMESIIKQKGIKIRDESHRKCVELFAMSLFSNYKVVFFDLFFTLVNPIYQDDELENEYTILGIEKDVWEKASEALYHERGIGMVKEPYEMIRQIAHSINPEIPHETLLLVTEARVKRFKKCLKNVDEKVLRTIRAIKASHKKIGLISNADIIDTQGWEDSPLSEFFDVVIFSCNVGCVKPDRKIYELALEQMNEEPRYCLYVGDGGNNELVTAKEMGMTIVLTTNFIKGLWPERINEIQENADYIVDGLDEMLEMTIFLEDQIKK